MYQVSGLGNQGFRAQYIRGHGCRKVGKLRTDKCNAYGCRHESSPACLPGPVDLNAFCW